MEQLLQVVLQGRPSQQQFVLQRVVVQHPEKLEQKTQRGRFTAAAALQLSGCRERPDGVVTLDWLFFSLWASSTTRQAQSMEPRMAMSMVISS